MPAPSLRLRPPVAAGVSGFVSGMSKMALTSTGICVKSPSPPSIAVERPTPLVKVPSLNPSKPLR
jgi:hypothetical protein